MKKSLNRGIDNTTKASSPFQEDISEKNSNEAHIDGESPTSSEPFFIMTLEFEKGKYKKIKIFPSSDPTELAFNFCKENNLDFSSLKFLTKEISVLLTKYNSKQLDLFQSNNSIQEVEEEHIQTELTKSPEKNDEEKSQRSGRKFIYSSIDEDQCNKREGNEKAIVDNEMTVEEREGDGERKEEERDYKCSNNDFINYKEEYYPTDDDIEDVEFIKLNLKAQEGKESNAKEEEVGLNKGLIEQKVEQCFPEKGEVDQDDTRALLFNSKPQSQSQSQSIQSQCKHEENKTSKPSNTLQSTDNPHDNNASSRLSYTMKPHPKLSNFQSEDDELAKLLEVKRRKEEEIKQMQSELEDEEREKQRQEEQLFLEEQDRIEREEYIQYEKHQALKQHTSSKDIKKKNLILNEIDYNFIEDNYIQTDNRQAPKDNYKQLIIETSKSNGKRATPALNSDSNQHLFQYEMLTDNHNTSQRVSPLSQMRNERNTQCVTASNTQHKAKKDNGTSICSLKKNNFMMLKPEMNLNRCCSANIFEKLYSEAEMKRQMPKRPCHSSYRRANKSEMKISQTKSMGNTHIKINTSDLQQKNKCSKPVSKTPSASNRLHSQHRRSDLYNSHYAVQNKQKNSHSGNNKPRARNKIIQKEHNSYSTEYYFLHTTNSNLKPSSMTPSSHSKVIKTEHHLKKDKEGKVNALKLLTKKNLTNPLLKKKIEQIKKEFQEKYTFKPTINKPQELITEKQEKWEGKEAKSQKRQMTEMNKESFTSKDSHSKTKRRDCNAFNKNNEMLSKRKAKKNGMFNKSNDFSEPFKCINNASSMKKIKKEEAFLHLFKELDDDSDGVISSVHLSTSTVPDNIIALISPILNLVKHGITSFTAKTFSVSLNVLYEKMSSNNKQILLDHFVQKRKKEPKLHKPQSSNHYKAIIDNQTKSSSHSSDKSIPLSLSHNNIHIKKPIMNYNSFLKANGYNELKYPIYDSVN